MSLAVSQRPPRGGVCTYIRIFVTTTAVLASLLLYAAATEPDSTTALRELVVTERRELMPAQVIGPAQISNLASTSVADALKYLSGVQIKDYGGLGGQKTVNVRSLGSQHVGVYLDGVRITNVQNGTVDLGKYSLSTLESVSLYNANKSERLMTASEYASASTVYLRTRRPDTTSLRAAYTYGSFGTHRADLTASWRSHGFVDASFTDSRGDYPFRYRNEYEDTAGRRQNADIRMLRVEACGYYRGFQFHAYYFDSERGLPGGIVRRLSGRYTDVGREWDRNFFVQTAWHGHAGRWGVRAIGKYTKDYLHYNSDYPENIAAHANNRYRQQDAYGAVAFSRDIAGAGVSVSTDFRWSDLRCDVKNFSYVYRLDSKTSATAFWHHRGFDINGTLLYTHVADHTRGRAKPLGRLTWNVAGAWCRGAWTLRAFYKSVFRAPTLNDLYYTLVGNRNLRPEYTRQLDIGVAFASTWLNLQVDAYRNHVTDRIVCLPLKGSYQWTMLNYGYTRCLGVDITANLTWRHSTLLLTATFQDDRNRTDRADDAYNDFIAYSPRWSFTGVYTLNWREFYASLSHMFVGRRYWTAENAIEEPLSAYNCTDVKAGYRWRWLTVEAECQDLFDVRYELIQRWPMPGRRFCATLKINI